jgi:tRNA1(Val) A37 N6-methylase TrmN6
MKIDQIVPLEELGLKPDQAHEHAPTNDYLELWCLLKRQEVKGRSIVDLGCGAGAALCLFSRLPFSQIWGVELSPRLARTASVNFSKDCRVRIECKDARQFEHPVDIAYLFNPFPWHVLEGALMNLLRHGHVVELIYRNPKFAAQIQDATNWTCTGAHFTDSSSSRYFSATLRRTEPLKR